MSNERKLKGGLNLIPEANFPITPSEGTIFSSDGTNFPKGAYQFIDGNWESLTGNAAAEEADPSIIELTNDNFQDASTSGWMLTDGTEAQSTGSVAHNTTDTIAGAGDLRITSTALKTNTLGLPTLVKSEADLTTSPTIVLTEKIQKGQDINISFDLEIENSLNEYDAVDPVTAGFFPAATKPAILAELYDVTNSQSVGEYELTGEFNSFGETDPNNAMNSAITEYDGRLIKVNLNFKALSDSATDYELRIYTIELVEENSP